jgi:hypothetical protein
VCVLCAQGIVLASLFAVSHNIGQTKDAKWLETNRLRDDWAVQQIVTSANWGSTLGCFFTGGLNLQIEHHLFPAISFMHYPAISKIAKVRARACLRSLGPSPSQLPKRGQSLFGGVSCLIIALAPSHTEMETLLLQGSPSTADV